MRSHRFSETWLEAHRVDVSALVADDVIGIGHVQSELRSLIGLLRDPTRAAAAGAQLPRGVLFYGPPGTGKTLVGRHLARALGHDVPFFEFSADELSPDRVRGSFRYLARAHPRSVVFLDEIHDIATVEAAPDQKAVLVALLSALSGVVDTTGPLVVASTSESPNTLSPALLRAGRLGVKIAFSLPDASEREALLRHFARNKAVEEPIDWTRAAEQSSLSTPADIEQMVNDAIGLALADGRASLSDADLRLAIHRDGKVAPKPAERDPKLLRRGAIHEAGHAVVGALLLGIESVRRVSLDADGGTTLVGLEGEVLSSLSTKDLQHRLAVSYAGAAAERALLGGASLSSFDDVHAATSLLSRMADAGLVDGIHLARDTFRYDAPKPLDAVLIPAMAAMAAAAVARATDLVTAKTDAVETLAERLVAAGSELAGEELRDALLEAGLPAVPGETLSVLAQPEPLPRPHMA